MKNAPCYNGGKDCPDRTIEPNCHDTCERYLKWLDAHRSAIHNKRMPHEADAHTKENIERYCKRAKTKRRVGQT